MIVWTNTESADFMQMKSLAILNETDDILILILTSLLIIRLSKPIQYRFGANEPTHNCVEFRSFKSKELISCVSSFAPKRYSISKPDP